MYKFLGKKGKFYSFDPNEIIMKLNYRCEKGTVEADSFSCGKTPEERKQNYEKQHLGKAKSSSKQPTRDKSFPITEIKTSKDYRNSSNEAKLAFLNSEIAKGHRSSTLSDGSRLSDIVGRARKLTKEINLSKSKTSISNITLETKQLVNKTKSVIEKAKKEKSTGSISKETRKELVNSVNKLKSIATNTNKNESKPKLKPVKRTIEEEEADLDKLKTNISKRGFKNLQELDDARYLDATHKYVGEYKTKNIPKFNNWTDKEFVGFYTAELQPSKDSNLDDKHTKDLLNKSDTAYYKINDNISIPENKRSETCNKIISGLENAIDNSTIKKDTFVFRGISEEGYNKMVSAGMIVGKTFKCNRFTSTTKDFKIAEQYAHPKNGKKCNIIQCEIPKGTHAVDVTDVNKNWDAEQQIILNTNQKYEIVSIEENDKFRLIKWRAIK